MRSVLTMLVVWSMVWTAISMSSIDGIVGLVNRRLPEHKNDFTFRLVPDSNTTDALLNDVYNVSSTIDSNILIEGNSPIALASGLHRYLTDVLHVDIFWGIVTFSYTTAFWSWEDWELQLDWMALRGINLPLAWVGQEKILVDTFREIGLTDEEILPFFSGPAFQAWNRFGNIQGSWGGGLPIDWLEDQFQLQKEIVARMVELGMTPVLPAFTGFVPRAITRVRPGAQVVNGSRWEDFPTEYTNVTFLEPLDTIFAELQKNFIERQAAAYGNVTHIYTLDQYNENNPYSGDQDYLRNVSSGTWQSLKAADSRAIWLMQGWLFFSNSEFWTVDRIKAYLGGVEEDKDMLILDLFSESSPQWQRTNSYFGKPWIWCQLHNYGGNMGLYGQVMNVTINPILALAESSSLVGFGLTMEGQEGNEIMYDLLLDQSWSSSPIDTAAYFSNWVSRRYRGSNSSIPTAIYMAWDILRTTVYNNTNLTSATAVTKSIFELSPSSTGLLGRTGRHGTTINYKPDVLSRVWRLMYSASVVDAELWEDPAYQYDMVDISRQVFSNTFNELYVDLIGTYTSVNRTTLDISAAGERLTSLLSTLDAILLTNGNFALATWLSAARASSTNSNHTSFLEYNARNQITLWGPRGQISDYASKSWGGLVKGYYLPRWQIFVNYLLTVDAANYNDSSVDAQLLDFSLAWQTQEAASAILAGPNSALADLLERAATSGWI
ncbi:hypothetical protein PVAG01_09965 [Phlyctema vagabunda]|uniref:Alpha-N-acetylglucosaminidase n=1 Tax=Phlyctema vagabunda TaxID=108571 RepID=A0ABR4P4L4_9HELO